MCVCCFFGGEGRVWGLGFGVSGLKFQVQGLGSARGVVSGAAGSMGPWIRLKKGMYRDDEGYIWTHIYSYVI